MSAGIFGRPTCRPDFGANMLSTTPTDYCLRLQDRSASNYFGSQAVKPNEHNAIDTAESHPLRGSTSWWRRIRISACNAVRDRNSPAIAQMDQPAEIAIGSTIDRFAGWRHPF